MNILSRFASILFTFIFFIQSTSWAAGKTTPDQHAMMKKVAEVYNGMSEVERRESFTRIISSRPAADQEFIKKQGNISKLTFPEMKYDKEGLSITVEKQTVKFVLISATSFMVKGREINFSSEKLEKTVESLEELFQEKTSSSFNFFFSEAHAVVGMKAAFLTAISVTVLLLVAGNVADSYYRDTQMSKCVNLLKQEVPSKGTVAYDQLLVDAQRLERDLRLENLKDVRIEGFTFLHWIKRCVQTIQEGKLPVVFNELKIEEVNLICDTYRAKSDGIRTKPSDGEIAKVSLEIENFTKSFNFQKSCFYDREACERAVTCLSDVANDLGSMKTSISQTERSVIEEVPRKTSKEIPPSSASKKE